MGFRGLIPGAPPFGWRRGGGEVRGPREEICLKITLSTYAQSAIIGGRTVALTHRPTVPYPRDPHCINPTLNVLVTMKS